MDLQNQHCGTCGMFTGEGEYHPYAFCVLKLAGMDPWSEIKAIDVDLGGSSRHWPARPPLVRDMSFAPRANASA